MVSLKLSLSRQNSDAMLSDGNGVVGLESERPPSSASTVHESVASSSGSSALGSETGACHLYLQASRYAITFSVVATEDQTVMQPLKSLSNGDEKEEDVEYVVSGTASCMEAYTQIQRSSTPRHLNQYYRALILNL